MRYGVISDVHGNLLALQSIVASLRAEGVDGWLSVGDLIGYGPHPNECVELVAELGAFGIAGNHELIVLGKLAGVGSSARARDSHARTASLLNDDTVRYLDALPVRVERDGVVLAHGSLDDPEDYVTTAQQAARQLAQLARENPAATVLILGNTHRQLMVSESGSNVEIRPGRANRWPPNLRHLFNPGAVGQSRQWEWPPRARALVLDVEQRCAVFHRVHYNARKYRKELRHLQLPYRSMHSPPAARSVLSRRLRRLVVGSSRDRRPVR